MFLSVNGTPAILVSTSAVPGPLTWLLRRGPGLYARRRLLSLVDQHVRERRPRSGRDAVLAQRLQADVVRAGVEVRVDHLRDPFGVAVRDDRIDQPVGAAVGEIG